MCFFSSGKQKFIIALVLFLCDLWLWLTDSSSLDQKNKRYKLHTLFVFFCLFCFHFICVNVAPEVLSTRRVSISLDPYHKPPWYSGEIALGSGFQCLTRYSALPMLPGCVGAYVLYVHLESFTHLWCIPTASAVKIQIQWCQWNNVFFKKKCMCMWNWVIQ